MICPKCKGKGEIKDYEPLLGVLTLGLITLISLSMPGDECRMCKGVGQVRNLDLDKR